MALRMGRSLRHGEAKLNAKFGNGGVYKNFCFLGCDAMYTDRKSSTFLKESF